MDLFELLLIAVFLVFPLLDQLLKGARGKGQPPGSGAPDGAEEGGDPAEDRAPVSAADMVPEDLWAVLTGETRSGGGVATAETEPAVEAGWETGGDAPWSGAPDAGEAAEETSAWAQGLERGAEPVSLEYRGPEAYSLEEVDIEPVSLERPLPSPRARHQAFHELIDRPPRRVRTRRSAMARALANPDSVRQAVVLAEILGPPKGLE